MKTWALRLSLIGLAVIGSLLLMEVVARVALKAPARAFTDARYSARYHHATPDFLALLARLREASATFRGNPTVVVLGDSFVEGESVRRADRFTAVMQDHADARPAPRLRLVNLGHTSYSPIVYERLYRDVVLPLDPDIVIVCLDQTDVADDVLYEGEVSTGGVPAGSGIPTGEFTDTILESYQAHPVRFFLLRHFRLVDRLDAVLRDQTGSGIVALRSRFALRDALKLRLYLDTCRDPEWHGELFARSERFIRSMARLKPPRQQLYFVTYPRAENLAGQRKTTLLRGLLRNGHQSAPYFEHWVKKTDLAAQLPGVTFVHTSDDFRAAIAASGRQYYFHERDVHWNPDGHRLFADILERRVLAHTSARPSRFRTQPRRATSVPQARSQRPATPNSPPRSTPRGSKGSQGRAAAMPGARERQKRG